MLLIGVYTTKKDWENIIEDSREDLINPLSGYPLWVPRFDQSDNMNFFVPFGGWTSIGMKQVYQTIYYSDFIFIDIFDSYLKTYFIPIKL
jgi:hypothetical protein